MSESEALIRATTLLQRDCGSRIRVGLRLAALTTFRIGGPAALYLEPQDDADLFSAGRAVRETGIPVVILGKGSNVLVSDTGFPGLVIRLGQAYRWVAREGQILSAGGAMPLPALAGVALRHALAGIEFGVAIPASLGGAARMNAGAHGREMADVVDSLDLVRLLEARRDTVAASALGFAYRRTDLPPDVVVVGARLRLEPGQGGDIRAAMDEAREWRRRTQPVAEPNCGSVFKNPEGDHAARLIDASGLKGVAIGGAQVSRKHANFIVASPGARAADVLGLIRLVQERVHAETGIRLEPEVRLVGAFEA